MIDIRTLNSDFKVKHTYDMISDILNGFASNLQSIINCDSLSLEVVGRVRDNNFK